MIITLVIDTFNINNNGTTMSATRFAPRSSREGTRCAWSRAAKPDDAPGQGSEGPEMFYVPELLMPIASWLAHRQNTLFAKPDREVLTAAIKGADVVHIYQPWPLGRAAERVARQLGVPAIAAFHVQPENITYNIGLGWFPPAAQFVYVLLRLALLRALRRHPLSVDLHRGAAPPPRVPGPAPRDLQRCGQQLPAGTGPGTGRR